MNDKTTATYSTKSEAITHGVLPALAWREDEYDIDAIADEVVFSLGGQRGFAVVHGYQFWATVAKHAR